jgi:hypothetical protein
MSNPNLSVINKAGYAYSNGEPNGETRHCLIVSFVTDRVSGAYHQPIDLMNWIAANPYVDQVVLHEPYNESQTDDLLADAAQTLLDHFPEQSFQHQTIFSTGMIRKALSNLASKSTRSHS